jgi:hypothetical protein
VPNLVVLMSFDYTEDGELVAVGEPQDLPNEDMALRRAKDLATKHAGVLAWSRTADPVLGEYGEPREIFRAGDVPDME